MAKVTLTIEDSPDTFGAHVLMESDPAFPSGERTKQDLTVAQYLGLCAFQAVRAATGDAGRATVAGALPDGTEVEVALPPLGAEDDDDDEDWGLDDEDAAALNAPEEDEIDEDEEGNQRA